MTAALTTLFAVLALLTMGGTVAALWAAGRPESLGYPLADRHLRGAASAVTGVAMFGSLYYSEVAHYTPCELCWYQRIAMYSLAVILLVAVLRDRQDVWAFAVPLAALGLPISIWHVVVERVPAAGAFCDPLNPCSAIWVERFGFVTLPVMAGSGFAFVLAAGWLARSLSRLDPEVMEASHGPDPDLRSAPTPEGERQAAS